MQSVAIYEMLVSGKWRLALEFLERPDERILRQWRRAKERGAYPQLNTNGEPKDWSLMRAKLQAAMADVPVERKAESRDCCSLRMIMVLQTRLPDDGIEKL